MTEWNCTKCTLKNASHAGQCQACGAPRPPNMVAGGAKIACPQCTYASPVGTQQCPMCNTPMANANSASKPVKSKAKGPVRPLPPVGKEFLVIIKCRKLPKGTNPQVKLQQNGTTIAKTEPKKKETDPNFPYLSIEVDKLNKQERISFCLINHRGLMGSKKMGECKVSFRSLCNMFPSRDYALNMKDQSGTLMKDIQCFFRRVLRKSEQAQYDIKLNAFRKEREAFNRKKMEEKAKAQAQAEENALENPEVNSPVANPASNPGPPAPPNPKIVTNDSNAVPAAVGGTSVLDKKLLPRELSRPQSPVENPEKTEDRKTNSPPGGMAFSEAGNPQGSAPPSAKKEPRKKKKKKKKKKASQKPESSQADFDFDEGFGGDPFATDAAIASSGGLKNAGKAEEDGFGGGFEDPFGGAGANGDTTAGGPKKTNDDPFDNDDPFGETSAPAATTANNVDIAAAAAAGFGNESLEGGTDLFADAPRETQPMQASQATEFKKVPPPMPTTKPSVAATMPPKPTSKVPPPMPITKPKPIGMNEENKSSVPPPRPRMPPLPPPVVVAKDESEHVKEELPREPQRMMSPDRPPLMTDMFDDDDEPPLMSNVFDEPTPVGTNITGGEALKAPEPIAEEPGGEEETKSYDRKSPPVPIPVVPIVKSESKEGDTEVKKVPPPVSTGEPTELPALGNKDDVKMVPPPAPKRKGANEASQMVPPPAPPRRAATPAPPTTASTAEISALKAELARMKRERDEAREEAYRHERETTGLRLKLASATSLKVAAEAEARTTSQGGGSDENLQKLKAAMEQSHNAQMQELKQVAARREAELKAKLAQLEIAKQQLDGDYAAAIAERAEFKIQAENSERKHASTQEQLEKARDDALAAVSERDKLRTVMEQTKGLTKGIEGEALELKGKLAAAEADAQRWEAAAKQANASKLKTEEALEAEQKKSEQLEKEKQELQKQVKDQIAQFAAKAKKAAGSMIEKEASRRREAEERATMLEIELETVRSDLKEAQIEINDLQDTRDDALQTVQEELQDAQDGEEAARSELALAIKSRDLLKGQIEDVRKELEDAHKQIKSLIAEEKRYQPNIAAASNGLSSSNGSLGPRTSANLQRGPNAQVTGSAASVPSDMIVASPRPQVQPKGHNEQTIAAIKAYRGTLYKFCGSGLALAIAFSEVRKVSKLAPGLFPVVTVFGQVHQALFKIRLPQYFQAMEKTVLAPLFKAPEAAKPGMTQFARLEAQFFTALKKGFVALDNALRHGSERKAAPQTDEEEARCFQVLGQKISQALVSYSTSLAEFVNSACKVTELMGSVLQQYPGNKDAELKSFITYHFQLKTATLPLFQKMLKGYSDSAPVRGGYAFIDHWNGLATSVIRLEVHFFDAVMKNMEGIMTKLS